MAPNQFTVPQTESPISCDDDARTPHGRQHDMAWHGMAWKPKSTLLYFKGEEEGKRKDIKKGGKWKENVYSFCLWTKEMSLQLLPLDFQMSFQETSIYIVKGSLFQHKLIVFSSEISMWHAHIRRDHLDPMWKLHFGTCKDETRSLFMVLSSARGFTFTSSLLLFF